MGSCRAPAACQLSVDLYPSGTFLGVEDLYPSVAHPRADAPGHAAILGDLSDASDGRVGPRVAGDTGRRNIQSIDIFRGVQHAEAARLVERGAAAGKFRMASVQAGLRLGR